MLGTFARYRSLDNQHVRGDPRLVNIASCGAVWGRLTAIGYWLPAIGYIGYLGFKFILDIMYVGVDWLPLPQPYGNAI
jgi:hypothetical protein